MLDPFVVVLGIAQDAGYPQAGCRASCCARAWADPSARRRVACLGIVDGQQRWLIDATPDLPAQLHTLDALAGRPRASCEGILLTHAHIGHYTGLMYLGREGLGAEALPVYALPRMAAFLTGSGPWELLLRLGHVDLLTIEAERPLRLNERLTVTPFEVPHRGEYSETVGYRIQGPGGAVAFLPDIDSWDAWGDDQLERLIGTVDRCYLDGTFFSAGELSGRDPSQIPHPPIDLTLERLAALPVKERAKVRFLHLNHTNPAMDPESDAGRAIASAGCAVAEQGERLGLGGA